jgi:hypothetical protein
MQMLKSSKQAGASSDLLMRAVNALLCWPWWLKWCWIFDVGADGWGLMGVAFVDLDALHVLLLLFRLCADDVSVWKRGINFKYFLINFFMFLDCFDVLI